MAVNNVFGENADALDQVPDLEYKLKQLLVVLCQLTEQECFDIVRNCGEGIAAGAEAWRRLHRRYDASTTGRKAALLNTILRPGTCKELAELPGALERWEDQVRRYELRKDPSGARHSIPDDIKQGILESLVTPALQQHLHMNRRRIASYEELRREIVMYYEASLGSVARGGSSMTPATGNDPMDVGSLYWQQQQQHQQTGKDGKKGKDVKGGKGGKNGKGSNNTQFQGHCRHCQKWGHREKDCWNKQSGKPMSKDKGKGKGKDKGKGKGGKPVNSLDATTANPETTEQTGDVSFLDLCALSQYEVQQGHVELNLDTGAAGTVFPPDYARGLSRDSDLHPSERVSFRTADGTRLQSGTKRVVHCVLENDTKCAISGKIVNVHKPLLAASEVCARGMRVILTSDGGAILNSKSRAWKMISSAVNKAKKEYKKDFIPLRVTNGVYVLKCKPVPIDENGTKDLNPLETGAEGRGTEGDQSFQRQGFRL
eukprot:6492793-Amphidinium_carterae.2